ncbi:MAG TPA: hypothetical protein PLE30_09175 [Candidatus Kapabacteria bacterium]|nr:hypothetical protein [Candidatus Kapabacteria bacterium]
MNKHLLIAIFSIIAILVPLNQLSAQQEIIDKMQADLTSYSKAFNDHNWVELVEFLYPKLFEFNSKESTIAEMSKPDNTGLTMKMNDMKIIKISKPIHNNNEILYHLFYNVTLNVLIDASFIPQVEMMHNMFKSEYGKDNVTFDKNTNRFKIKATLRMLAITQNEGKSYYYLDNEKGNNEFLSTLFDKTVVQEILKAEKE